MKSVSDENNRLGELRHYSAKDIIKIDFPTDARAQSVESVCFRRMVYSVFVKDADLLN
jgi:hypothetical protein